MIDLFTSRQFIAAFVGLLIVFFGERAGISGEQVTEALYLLMTYIVGRGLQVGLSSK